MDGLKEKEKIEELKEQSRGELRDKRFEFVNRVMSKETFIDPLNPDEVTKAYSVYGRDPSKVQRVVAANFQQYCKKCIREVALIEHKNELSNAVLEEAEKMQVKITADMFQQVKSDPELEQLLLMLLFKNRYWSWVRFGLKDIFTHQRTQPGHTINNYLNTRFHTLKDEKGLKTVGDLVLSDITEIVNRFKKEVIGKNIKIF